MGFSSQASLAAYSSLSMIPKLGILRCVAGAALGFLLVGTPKAVAVVQTSTEGVEPISRMRPNWRLEQSRLLEYRTFKDSVPEDVARNQNLLRMDRHRSLKGLYEEAKKRAISPELAATLQAEANSRFERLEQRRRQGLSNAYEVQAEYNDLERWLYKSRESAVERIQGECQSRHEKEGENLGMALLEREPILKTSLLIAYAPYYVYKGRPVHIPIFPGKLELTTRTPIEDKSFQIELRSMLIDSTFRTDFKVPETTDQTRDPGNFDERYRIQVARVIPLIGVGTELAFGSTTRTASMKFERALLPNLSGSVEMMQPLDPGRSHIRQGSHLVKLSYRWDLPVRGRIP